MSAYQTIADSIGMDRYQKEVLETLLHDNKDIIGSENVKRLIETILKTRLVRSDEDYAEDDDLFAYAYRPN